MSIHAGAFTLFLTSVAVVALTAAQGSLDNDLHVVVPRDAIPAINKPEFEPVERAERYMNDRELVIGLVSGSSLEPERGAKSPSERERGWGPASIGSEQRAYSTWQLDRHEIVNDTFEGRLVAVTW
jgi:hypothetical protein